MVTDVNVMILSMAMSVTVSTSSTFIFLPFNVVFCVLSLPIQTCVHPSILSFDITLSQPCPGKHILVSVVLLIPWQNLWVKIKVAVCSHQVDSLLCVCLGGLI